MSSSLASEEGSHQQSDRYGSYCPSADVSDSETSFSTASSRRFHFGASSAANSFFPAALPLTPPFMSPDIAPKNVLYWEDIMPLKQNPLSDLSEIEMMKERFAKLLLGEDMSGGSRGVSTALAISNAITNLSATVFGELWRLEPLAPQKKAMWCREMDWLLCVSDSIVELVPSVQNFPGGGGTYEVMTTRPRSDLYMNLPALKKLDEMLVGVLDGFCETEFWYVDRRVVLGEGDDLDVYSAGLPGGRPPSIRQEEKWWLPCPKVPPKGLSEERRKKIQQCRDCTNQILKAALAINSNVLAEIEIPKAYLDTLPKSGKACLGENIYRYITAEQFSPERLLDCLGLSSEHQMLEIANRTEAAVYVWKLKDKKKRSNHQKSKNKSWGGKVKGLVGDGEKNHFLAHRAETLLRTLRIRFPSLPQTSLDMNKILHNKDVGQSILESYSRVMESLAFNIMARIDDVLFVDDATKQCAAAESMSFFSRGGLGGLPVQKRMSPSPFSVRHTPYASPLATPTFCPSPPLSGTGSSRKGVQIHKPEKLMPIDLDKLWASYAGNLSSRRTTGDALERD